MYLAIFIAFIQIFFNDSSNITVEYCCYSMPCKNWSACLKTVREKCNWECSMSLYFFYLRCLFWRYRMHQLTVVRKTRSTPEQKHSHQFWKFWTTRMHMKILTSIFQSVPLKAEVLSAETETSQLSQTQGLCVRRPLLLLIVPISLQISGNFSSKKVYEKHKQQITVWEGNDSFPFLLFCIKILQLTLR